MHAKVTKCWVYQKFCEIAQKRQFFITREFLRLLNTIMRSDKYFQSPGGQSDASKVISRHCLPTCHENFKTYLNGVFGVAEFQINFFYYFFIILFNYFILLFYYYYFIIYSKHQKHCLFFKKFILFHFFPQKCLFLIFFSKWFLFQTNCI